MHVCVCCADLCTPLAPPLLLAVTSRDSSVIMDEVSAALDYSRKLAKCVGRGAVCACRRLGALAGHFGPAATDVLQTCTLRVTLSLEQQRAKLQACGSGVCVKASMRVHVCVCVCVCACPCRHVSVSLWTVACSMQHAMRIETHMQRASSHLQDNLYPTRHAPHALNARACAHTPPHTFACAHSCTHARTCTRMCTHWLSPCAHHLLGWRATPVCAGMPTRMTSSPAWAL